MKQKPLSRKDERFAEIINLFTKLIVICGLLFTIWQMRHDAQKERKDRQQQIYSALDEGFIEWEKLRLNYPHLDIFDVADSILPTLTPKEQK